MSQVYFNNFALDVPPGWTLATLILTGPVPETVSDPQLRSLKTPRSFQQNLVATMEQVDPNITPESYVQQQIEGLHKAGVIRHEAKPPEKVQLQSGLEGLLTEQVIIGGDGEWVRQMQLVTLKEGIAHTLITSHIDGPYFEQAREQFRAMLLSFT
jgi:hypothetical protein